MTSSNAYRHQRTVVPTRIDTILGLYYHALRSLEEAETALAKSDLAQATPLVNKTLLAITGLVAGIERRDDELSANMLRLYEFVTQSLLQGTPEKLAAAKNVLQTLNSGFEGIRDEAVRLERAGAIPSINSPQFVRAMA